MRYGNFFGFSDFFFPDEGRLRRCGGLCGTRKELVVEGWLVVVIREIQIRTDFEMHSRRELPLGGERRDGRKETGRCDYLVWALQNR